MPPPEPHPDAITVLLIDDSALHRMAIADAIRETDGLHLVGHAASAERGLEAVARLKPAAVVLDLLMPGIGGLGFLRALTRRRLPGPKPAVLVYSGTTQAGARMAVEACALGAVDCLAKPDAARGLAAVRQDLIPRLLALRGPPGGGRRSMGAARRSPRATGYDVLLLAASTGGPLAVERALAPFPADFPLPILLVQHMPVGFTDLFASHLANRLALRVAEARDGEPLRPGHVLVAPGGRHLAVARQHGEVTARLVDSVPREGLRPAADVLFTAAAEVFGARVMAAVFTGMGRDGTVGALHLHRRGACVLAQRAAGCVVFGMPRSVQEAGICHGTFSPTDFFQTVRTFMPRT